ncbi:hypothetical protein SCATT_20770 [Streptantibioticus cattleyicolor NRRL 8057 = DSM 46488]|uniref:Uncharacterized protein n=1 Tax=Streptantibioticus cattleyicolor (strain ATCC 35852 / DSM 46488 / JCM 4925 / NBRC 14057 / NRRL 8057) TaxID=1003195 RepID=G8WZF2_STREN|nr:hypothetical protein SCATT_20770 [Streptantibioticus cattleyicolor NRRL 8057 = DSM 46488]
MADDCASYAVEHAVLPPWQDNHRHPSERNPGIGDPAGVIRPAGGLAVAS